jgi:membrane glycosyltransferase
MSQPADKFFERAAKPRLQSMPEIHRVSMTPSVLERRPLRHLRRRLAQGPDPMTEPRRQSWERTARRRRIILAILVLVQTAVASWSLAWTFPAPQITYLQIAVVAGFSVLFLWISFSFWTNIAGFLLLWRNVKIRNWAVPDSSGPLRSRTAVVMPICNEDVARVFAGLAATFQSLAQTGHGASFDFFVLSDTGDSQRQAEEEAAWARTRRAVHGEGQFFYRRRRNNIKRKSGNIGDFLRRWSADYDFMIVLDADSLMSGESIVALARRMEASPEVGIIQTTPTIVNRESLFARVQQFSSRVYGPLFSASLFFWQLGESYYWGHNAILRIEPFVRHCGLARLPGKPPLGGEILSHDFVEAALMGRAGFEVWLATDLPGSYEESPPNILDELKRDRRWCQGNLQHLRLICADGLRFGHRAIMAMGVMAYASALLWAVFLFLSSAEVIAQQLTLPVYFSYRPSLFPDWPTWHPELTIALLTTTGVLLILPKLLSFVLILKNRESHGYGGALRLLTSIALEIVFSTLMAPIRMWFHSKFVLLTLFGREIKWTAQQRNHSETSWGEAVERHGFSTLFATAWLFSAFCWSPILAAWLLPISAALVFSVPISVYSSRVALGHAARWLGLFQISEEAQPPQVLEGMQQFLSEPRRRAPLRGNFHSDWASS